MEILEWLYAYILHFYLTEVMFLSDSLYSHVIIQVPSDTEADSRDITDAAVMETTSLLHLPSLITDRRLSIFGHICQLLRNTPVSEVQVKFNNL